MFKDYMTLDDFRREIPIMELALSVGYELLPREGLKWPVLKDRTTGDKIIIINPSNPSNQGYFNPHDDWDKGILTHFIKNRLGTYFDKDPFKTEYENVYRIMYDFAGSNVHSLLPAVKHGEEINASTPQETSFNLKEGLLRPLTDKSFLLTRGISERTLDDPLFAGRIFNSSMYGHTNTAFPYYNISGNMTALEVRNQGFKHFYPGSILDSSVWHSDLNGNKQSVVLAESPVDALSYHQLKGSENNIYIAFGGTVSLGQLEMVKCIRTHCGHVLPSISAVDNDVAGEAYNRKFQAVLGPDLEIDKPSAKDYNEQLIRLTYMENTAYHKKR